MERRKNEHVDRDYTSIIRRQSAKNPRAVEGHKVLKPKTNSFKMLMSSVEANALLYYLEKAPSKSVDWEHHVFRVLSAQEHNGIPFHRKASKESGKLVHGFQQKARKYTRSSEGKLLRGGKLVPIEEEFQKVMKALHDQAGHPGSKKVKQEAPSKSVDWEHHVFRVLSAQEHNGIPFHRKASKESGKLVHGFQQRARKYTRSSEGKLLRGGKLVPIEEEFQKVMKALHDQAGHPGSKKVKQEPEEYRVMVLLPEALAAIYQQHKCTATLEEARECVRRAGVQDPVTCSISRRSIV
uniref:Uncharacterized protein n=1 Tax=Branchiostoma floridae TaxID=7739 RepID=C3ZGE8_BRAFL|eukprot:XP_002592381.1 hypothetical protein BRAFLDRAFT_67242 [Branchiostoma floridae]